MDSLPTLVLIRPKAQSLRLLKECEAQLNQKSPFILAPVLKIVPIKVNIDLQQYSGVILTSENGVRYAPNLARMRVYCVGKRTAEAARGVDAEVLWTAQNTLELEERLNFEKPTGRLVHLHGQHVTKVIKIIGIETDSYVVYDQKAERISIELVKIISGDILAVLPLYSARSALLLGQGVECLGAGLHVIAISDAVARVWHRETGGDCEVCDVPDGTEVISKVVAALRQDSA